MQQRNSTPSGDQIILDMRKQTDTILLAFSCGKDAVASWIACRPHFERIVPYYMYLVPDLQFVERSLRYYEDFFETRILRVPHPTLYRWLNAGLFQTSATVEIIRHARLPEFDFLDMQDEIRKDLKLSGQAYTASGVRAADSPQRLLAIKTHGAVSHKKKQFFPVWDWKMERLLQSFKVAGVRLAEDYRVFGRSFDGLDYRFLEPIRRTWPGDFDRILQWFPLAEAELRRHEYAY